MGNAVIPGEQFYPNAFGRNSLNDDWKPMHLDADGKQRNRSGMLIKPYKQVMESTPEGVRDWCKVNNQVLLDPLQVP